MRNRRCSRSSSIRSGGRYGCKWKRFTDSINTTWCLRDVMTDTTLGPGEPPHKNGDDVASHWMRRVVLAVFCLVLLATLIMVFTRVVIARVPEQRATLEKLILDRTGLAVRFENVHFAWNLDGTQAVFTH